MDEQVQGKSLRIIQALEGKGFQSRTAQIDILVQLTSVSRKQASRWLTGSFNIPFGRIATIAEFAGVRPMWIENGEEPMQAPDNRENGRDIPDIDVRGMKPGEKRAWLIPDYDNEGNITHYIRIVASWVSREEGKRADF